MRVAFVSYEFPPDTALGGISTYVSQMARCLSGHGVDVEVFCGSLATGSSMEGDFCVHRVKSDRMAFSTAVLSYFHQRHRERPFDIIEGPDYLAEANAVARSLPEVPYVVKLHTPYYIVKKLNRQPITRKKIRDELRLLWYVLKTRDFRALHSFDHKIYIRERNNLRNADEIIAPSRAIALAVSRMWNVNRSRISLVHLVYDPPSELLSIPIGTETQRVTYIGRLEPRKGPQDLAAAIPAVLRNHPDTLFRFVGAIGVSPTPEVDMKTYILDHLRPEHRARVEFTDGVPPNAISRYLTDTDVCVFPSRWESFGFVVLEAMSAGRAVVCTGNSGMAELVNHGEFGLVVPPKDPPAIAENVSRLLGNPTLRYCFGRKARVEGLGRYAASTIAPLQLQSYERAIVRKRRTRVHPVSYLRKFQEAAFGSF